MCVLLFVCSCACCVCAYSYCVLTVCSLTLCACYVFAYSYSVLTVCAYCVHVRGTFAKVCDTGKLALPTFNDDPVSDRVISVDQTELDDVTNARRRVLSMKHGVYS